MAISQEANVQVDPGGLQQGEDVEEVGRGAVDDALGVAQVVAEEEKTELGVFSSVRHEVLMMLEGLGQPCGVRPRRAYSQLANTA